jgi:hypothetical protein
VAEAPEVPMIVTSAPATAAVPLSVREAHRLADQATFGPTEANIADIRVRGRSNWVAWQMGSVVSRYTSGNGDSMHKNVGTTAWCDQAGNAGPYCWRDWYSSSPLAWDFYRNATQNGDQLRQRVAFALSQILVINNMEVEGTYGLRYYHNMLLTNSFGNYRQLLKRIVLSPAMGDFLNNVNNDKDAPNENFARELLQLFSIGTCELNLDGSLKGGACTPTYDNDTIRSYAYALTGWTYPAGGSSTTGCWPSGTNCRYLGSDMVPVARYHDGNPHTLLSGVSVPAASTAPQALERVLDSVIQHPNTAPFIGKQLIQHLVTANPTPAYVQRVATAFNAGRFTSEGVTFGSGQRGDLAATIAAILTDSEAREPSNPRRSGKLREPVLMFTALLRGLNGRTDGYSLTWWWGEALRQHVFRAPSVFNFYPPDYPLAGTPLVGPSFGVHNANSALERLNYLTYLLYWGGSEPVAGIPNAIGTTVNTTPFEADAADPAKLVDRISVIATGGPLPAAQRTQIINAVTLFTLTNAGAPWKTERVRQAIYLVFASPAFQIQR